MLTNIDVTLRDGGYRNNFSFTLDYAREHAKLSVAAGMEWVEVAYRKGSARPVEPLRLTARGDDDYIASIADVIGPEHVGLMLHPRNIDRTDIPAIYHAGGRLLRICVPVVHPEDAFDCVRQAKDVGFTVCANLTRVSQMTGHEIVKLVTDAIDAQADVIYLADSNGSMMPGQVAEVMTLCGALGPHAVGMHTHNNLGLALPNSIAAMDAGATWIDSSFLGMGKGPGNLRAEHWIAYLIRASTTPFDLGAALHLADLLERSIPESKPALPLPDLVLGHFNLSVDMRGTILGNDLWATVRHAESLRTLLAAA